MQNIEAIQAEHYNRIGEAYAIHYGDVFSQQYRNQFINEPMLGGLQLKDKSVLEAMCGSGETTQYLLDKGAKVTGLDVSEKEIFKFKARYAEATGVCASIFDTNIESESFDSIIIVGGLHHLHPNLNAAMKEMHRILKPGGFLCFAEPHAESILDIVRRFWYKHDDLFAENEEAVDVRQMKQDFKELFHQNKEVYTGGLAYLLVLNSMVFRIPQSIKKLYAPFVLWLEGKLQKLQSAKTACMVTAQWQKK